MGIVYLFKVDKCDTDSATKLLHPGVSQREVHGTLED